MADRNRGGAGRIALFPASFDPITNGHLDLIRRSRAIFDETVLAIARNVSKNATFSVEEVARRFKRAKRDDVQAILETFVALGRLVSFEDPRGDRRWARPGPAA